jgi:hypothetical protein
MELALTVFNIGAGVGILAVGVSVAYLAWRLTPLIAETRAMTEDVRRLTRATERELRPLLDRARDSVRAAEVLTDDAAVKVARLRDAVDTLDEIARGQGTATGYPGSAGSVEFGQTREEPSNP